MSPSTCSVELCAELRLPDRRARAVGSSRVADQNRGRDDRCRQKPDNREQSLCRHETPSASCHRRTRPFTTRHRPGEAREGGQWSSSVEADADERSYKSERIAGRAGRVLCRDARRLSVSGLKTLRAAGVASSLLGQGAGAILSGVTLACVTAASTNSCSDSKKNTPGLEGSEKSTTTYRNSSQSQTRRVRIGHTL